MSKTLQKVILFTFFLASIFFILFIYSRGILFNDEGWVLHPAQRVLQGDIIYKDFHHIYTPGSIFTSAIGMLIFGQSILATRLTPLIFIILTFLVLLNIFKNLRFKLSSIIISLSLYLAWLPIHTNFSWPSIYAVFFGTLTCALLLKEKVSNLSYFFAGVTSSVVFLYKQNFGIAIIASCLIYFFINKQLTKIFSMLVFILGIFSVFSVWICYMFYTNSFFLFLKDFYYFTIQKGIGENVQATAFIYPGPLYLQVLKIVFYISPLIISVFAYFAIKKHNHLKIIPIASLLFYVIGIRPTTDLTHLLPLISFSAISAGLAIEYSKKNTLRILMLSFIVLLTLTGIYSSLFRGYYKWHPKIIEHTNISVNSKVNVLIDSKSKTIIDEVGTFINKNSKKNDYIFITQYSPMLYYIFDRKNPTKFEFLPSNLLTDYDRLEIINNLINKKVNIIISDYEVHANYSTLDKFITKNYKMEKTSKDYYLWLKK